jgi:hypothetical protein
LKPCCRVAVFDTGNRPISLAALTVLYQPALILTHEGGFSQSPDISHAGDHLSLAVPGADAANIMGGCYPAGGINIGPAMVFGYITGMADSGSTSLSSEPL